MTSQSRTKRPTTAPTFTRVTRLERAKTLTRRAAGRLTLATLVAGGVLASSLSSEDALAQQGMRPVPRFQGTSIKDPRGASHRTSSSNLQWRTSREVAPVVPVPDGDATTAVAAANVTKHDLPAAGGISQASATQPSGNTSSSGATFRQSGVQQARYQGTMQLPGESSPIQLPPGLQPEATTPQTPAPLKDFFSDPFGDETPAVPAPQKQEAAPELPASPSLPSTSDDVTPGVPMPPALDEAEDAAEPSATQPGLPSNGLRAPVSPMPTESDDVDAGAERPSAETTDDLPPPSNLSPPNRLEPMEDRQPDKPATEPESNPFDRDRNGLGQRGGRDEMDLRRPAVVSCDDFRRSIAEATIQTVSLDISPPFRPDVIEVDEFDKLKRRFDEAQQIRDWRSIDGRRIGRGRLRDLAYEKIVIETEQGTLQELQVNQISEGDLAYLSSNWGLPRECLLEQAEYKGRSWTRTKMTWKASNLCHKPLYFEEVNLERYGHDAGPFAQPIISSAHFFANIAVLPYKMGVHHPSECQYTLGYYRPGNCAPWIVPPVPISLRGGLYQAAAMTGAFWLIP